jgi:hypothetical protein
MNQSSKNSRWGMNERGFTMAELLIGSAISLIMLGLVAGIISSQKSTFSRQNQLGQMQANGRASVDFVTRSVQNAGFNVTRGKRFLAASDHYITMVFDDDNDGTIQNDEVMTYAVSNPDNSTLTSFSIDPFFDDDGDGAVDSTETRTYSISMGLENPPFHFYRITPDQGTSDVTKSKVARNIDNLIIRYWDKNGDPLPADVTTDADENPVPPYTLASSELNEIRKVTIEVVTRSKDEDPNESYVNSGTYYTGSVATAGGTTSYSDRYRRETYTAVTSPRNLVTAPWGKISLVANPTPISCPDDSTAITADVIDSDGEKISYNTDVNFTTSEGTLSPATNGTGSSGAASTTLTYDWSSPSVTATVSASALIDVDGVDYPVFNAIPVSFESGTGIFSDDFSDGDTSDWTEGGAANWNITASQYKTSSNGFAWSLNGCAAWQDYVAQVDIQRNGSLAADESISLVFRYQDADQYYMAKVSCSSNCGGSPNDDVYVLELVNYDSVETSLVSSTTFDFDNNEYYTLKAEAVGDELNAKFWQTSVTEPTDWDITVTDTAYSQGEIALTTNTSTSTFDNVVVTPAS